MVLLDIGNTRVKIAGWDGCRIGAVRSVPRRDFVLPEGEEIAALSAVPEWTRRLRRTDGVFLLQNIHAARCGLDLSGVDASTLGADRLANAIELVHENRLPAISVDFGTAVNCEIVDREGFFRGGAIAPGRNMMLQALFNGTAALPELQAGKEIRERPGTNTAETLAFGVDQGIAGMVERWVRCAGEMLSGSVRLVGTGGDAPLYCREIDGMENGGETFTLRGLLYAWQKNAVR